MQMRRRKMKISTKLLVGFTVIILILILVLLVSTISNKAVVQQADNAIKQTDASEKELLDFRLYNDVDNGIKEMIQTVLNLGYVSTLEEKEQVQQQFQIAVENLTTIISGSEDEETYLQKISEIQASVEDVFNYKESEILSQKDLLNDQEKLKQFIALKRTYAEQIKQMQAVDIKKVEQTVEI